MKHLSKPTAKLPNKRLIVEEDFINDLVDVVNELSDEVDLLKHENGTLMEEIRRVDALIKKESFIRQTHDLGLEKRLDDLSNALEKVARAVQIILGGE